MTKRITVLVTAVGGRSVGYQILESLKMTSNAYRIVTADIDPFSPGLYEADASYLLPEANDSSYIDKLLKLIELEKIEVILPGSQAEVRVIAKNEDIIKKSGALPIVSPYSVVENSFNKNKLNKFLKEKNILIPPTVVLGHMDDAKSLKFPIVVKPSKDTSGSRNVYIIKDMDELKNTINDLKKEGIEIFAQEYVGSEDEEYTVGILIGSKGDLIDTIVMRRKLIGLSRGLERVIDGKNYVLSTGYSQGFFVDQPDVKEYCEHVARVIGAIGPLNIQCRRGEKGVYVFEVHPRFSGSASMRALMGFNEPDILIKNFLGMEPIKDLNYQTGYAVIRKFANTVVKMEDYKRVKKL
jgi:carbamoyl-phosphate synthase large subunit